MKYHDLAQLLDLSRTLEFESQNFSKVKTQIKRKKNSFYTVRILRYFTKDKGSRFTDTIFPAEGVKKRKKRRE